MYNSKTKTFGTARHLIVTVEQLFKSKEGHLPRLYLLLRDTRFQKHIPRVNVDEAHHIATAGLAQHGLDAFRPAWGKLQDLKAILPANVCWHSFSATFPPYILKTVTAHVLKPKFTTIRQTSNRRNTMYATHRMINSVDETRNFHCFLQPAATFDLAKQPRTLIFVDSRALTSRISRALNTILPVEQRKKGIVRHYHSVMSEEYLKRAHASFTDPHGLCRVMIATINQSVVRSFSMYSFWY